jgi:hypothetical protein
MYSGVHSTSKYTKEFLHIVKYKERERRNRRGQFKTKEFSRKVKFAVFCNEKPFSLLGLYKISVETKWLVISGEGANLNAFTTHKIYFYIPRENQICEYFPISLHGTADENDRKGRYDFPCISYNSTEITPFG